MEDITKHLFTPRTKGGERLTMYLSNEDIAKIGRGRRWSATITNLEDNLNYKVKGAACNLPHCFCDAVVIERL